MALTVPTPIIPQSPVFVPHSPITVNKFFEAVSPEATESLGMEPIRPAVSIIPTLASCGDCGLFEFEHGLQCCECNERWLACKVWYRSQDGGRRRWLTEPYIRPAESNARNRALMHELGVPGCGANADTMETTCGNSTTVLTVQAWNSFRRLGRFLRAKAVQVQGLIHPRRLSITRKGNRTLYAGSTPLRPLRRIIMSVAGVGLENLWTERARYRPSHANVPTTISV